VAQNGLSPQPSVPRGGLLYSLSRRCLSAPAATLVVAGALTLFFGAIAAGVLPETITRALGIPSSGIEIDASTRSFVLKNDSDRACYQRFLEQFGSDTMIAVALECPGSYFDEAELRRTLAITQGLQALEHVKRVSSLATVPYPTPDGRLSDLDELLAHGAVERAALAEFAGQMRGNRVVRENLIADCNGGTSMIYVFFADGLDDEQIIALGVLDEVRRVVDERAGQGTKVYLVGNPLLRESLSRIIRSDLFIFVGATQILAALAVFAIFRRVRTVVVIMAFVWVTLAWTFGLFVIAGEKLNMVTAILCPFLITVCVTIAVHVFVQYGEERSLGAAGREAALRTVSRMGKPCFLTSFTTAIGLGSLVVNRLGPVRAFGTFGALGTMLSFVLAFALLPIALAAMSSPMRERPGHPSRHALLRLLGRSSHVCVTHPRLTLLVAAAVAVGAVLGISRLRVETRLISYFKSHEPIVQAYRAFDRKQLGITGLEVMVSGRADILSPDVEAQIEAFAERVRTRPHVASITSAVDYLHERERILNELKRRGDLSLQALASAAAKANAAMGQFVSADRTSTRINVRLTDVTSKVLLEAIGDINDAAARCFGPSLDVCVTGSTKLYANVVGTLVSGQVRSIIVAFVAITVVMAVVFRSFRIGLISMVPTTLPVLITLGMMGWIGVALNGATVMIASVAIGIVVDSAIHFLHRYRHEYLAAHDFETAITRTLLTVGRPISYAVLVLSCSFIVLAFGSFNPTNYFGIMTAFTMLISLVITLLLLPVCLNLFHFRFEKNSPARLDDD
jgi:predicted RND superfamily exporter protein